jgi:DNA recombination protein RmuC
VEIVLAVGIVVLAAVIAVAAMRRPAPAGNGTAMERLADAIQGIQVQTSVLAERMQATAERVSAIERAQSGLKDGVSGLGARLAESGTATSGLAQAAEAIRGEVAAARAGVTALQENAKARQDLERQASESLRRLEHVIAGSASRGAAAENLVDMVFARLPVEWQLRDFHVGNRVVEFALRLPNGLALPIDSKWPAGPLLDQFIATEEPQERQRLRAQIEATVLERAREVRKYLDPDITMSFGVAVVPDAVFEICSGAQTECFRQNVVLVAHSMFVPYLLLVVQTVLGASREVDLEKLAAYLHAAEQALVLLQEEIEGRLSKAATMVVNARDALRAQVAQVSTGLQAIQVRATPVDLAVAGEQAGAAAPAAALLPDDASISSGRPFLFEDGG